MSTKVALRKWIHQRLLVPPAAVQFRFHRVGALEETGRENVERIHVAKVREDLAENTAQEATRIADEVWPIVLASADMYEGELPSKYTVHSYHRGETGKLARGLFHGWRLQVGPLLRADSAGPSEPPTPRGQQQQLMRHTEAFAKLVVELAGAGAAASAAMIARQQEEITELREEARESWKLQKQLADDSTQREVVAAEVLGEEERKNALVRKLIDVAIPALAPAIIGLLKGKSLVVDAPPPPAPVPASSSSSASELARDDRANLRRMLSELPDELAGPLMKNLSPADRDDLLRMAGMA